MDRLKQIIDYIKSEITPKLDQLSDNCILENSVKIYLSEQIQGYKEKNITNISQKNETKSKILKASDKQLAYLLGLGYSGRIDLSKNEADALIKKLKEK